MKHYKVEITKSALQDMEDIYNYIAEELLAPENAMRQYNRIADAILSLDIFPEKYRLFEAELENSKRIRRMVVDNYSVFYVVNENTVVVTNVMYSASDIEARLRGE